MTFLFFEFLNLALIVISAVLTLIFFARFNKPEKSSKSIPASPLPLVSVIVPARNEEGKIERCLKSLIEQDYPHYEIIVIDDRSTDGTSQIISNLAAQYTKIKALSGQETPPGWTGKCYALHQATKHAQGEWFVFTDADTCHTTRSLQIAMNYASLEGLDLISFMPVQELGSFWERLVMPALLGSFVVGDPFNTINDPNNNRAYAYGQYIAIRRAAYESVGGHGSVQGEVLEDITFAGVVKRAGYRITAACGIPLYRVRMYTDLTSLWKGWTKNAYTIIGSSLTSLLLIILVLNLCMVGPLVTLIAMYLFNLSGTYQAIMAPIISLWLLEIGVSYVWYRKTSEYYAGTKWYDFFLLPLGSLAVTAIYISSAYLILNKHQVEWKGRTYSVNVGSPEEAPSNAKG